MFSTKHTEITQQLKDGILARRYADRLPPVRELTRDFATSVRTMTKALKPLIAEGLIVPGRNGTAICRHALRRPRTGIVNLVVTGGLLKPLHEDALLCELFLLAEQAGFQPRLLEVTDAAMFQDLEYWRTAPVDGHIFVYSSFYHLLSRQLVLHNIPFVVGNWMPINYGVHWVDFNNEQLLYALVEQIVAHGGNHRIALTFPGHVRSGQAWLQERWRGIADHFGLPDYGHDGLCYSRDLAAIADAWVRLPEPPEIAIVNHANPEILRDQFVRHGLPMQLVLREDRQSNVPAWRYPAADYQRLAREIWRVFAQVLDDTAGQPGSHLIEPSTRITFTDN